MVSLPSSSDRKCSFTAAWPLHMVVWVCMQFVKSHHISGRKSQGYSPIYLIRPHHLFPSLSPTSAPVFRLIRRRVTMRVRRPHLRSARDQRLHHLLGGVFKGCV